MGRSPTSPTTPKRPPALPPLHASAPTIAHRALSLVLHRLYALATSFLLFVLALGPIPRHVGFVMDGNRRYARGRGKRGWEGHTDGFMSLRRVSRAHVRGRGWVWMGMHVERRIGVDACTGRLWACMCGGVLPCLWGVGTELANRRYIVRPTPHSHRRPSRSASSSTSLPCPSTHSASTISRAAPKRSTR